MTATPATASDYFGSMVLSYDSLIRRAIPRYDEMLVRLVDYLPPRAERILELGCGTGNLSIALAQRYPGASLTYVDASQDMLDITAERVRSIDAQFASRARSACCWFEEIDPAIGPFDLVVSSISMHHVIDKGALYRAVFTLTQPGGSFRWSDQLRGGTDEIHARNWERWLEFCRKPGNCSEEEIQSLLDHAAAHDHYTPLAEHFRLLTEAGFQPPDCVWRDWMWAVVLTERAA